MPLDVDSRVAFIGLVGRADLNGTLGTIVSWDEGGRGRFGVHVDASGEIVLVKPENLEESGHLFRHDTIRSVARHNAEARAKNEDTPKHPGFIQHILIEGKSPRGSVPLGFFPLRTLEARNGGALAYMTSIASNDLDMGLFVAESNKKLLEETPTLTRLSRRLDITKVEDRTDGMQSLFKILSHVLCLMFCDGHAREGEGVVVVECDGNLQDVVKALLGTGPWVPIAAVFLSHKQSEFWYSSANEKRQGREEARRMAISQVVQNRRLIQQRGEAANPAFSFVIASFITHDLLPMTQGQAWAPLEKSAKTAWTLLSSCLHNAHVVRFDGVTKARVFDIFSSGDIGPNGTFVPAQNAGQSADAVVMTDGGHVRGISLGMSCSTTGKKVTVTKQHLSEVEPELADALQGK